MTNTLRKKEMALLVGLACIASTLFAISVMPQFAAAQSNASGATQLQMDVKAEQTSPANRAQVRGEAQVQIQNANTHQPQQRQNTTREAKMNTGANTESRSPFEAIRERAQHFIDNSAHQTNDVRAEIQTRIEQEKREAAARQERRAEAIEQKQQELQQQIEERRATIKEQVAEQRAEISITIQERIQANVDRMLERFNAAITRMTQIADRIAIRINEMEAAGTDLTDAQAQLDQARARIVEAGDTIDAITAEITVVITDPTEIRVAFTDIRAFMLDAKSELQAARDALTETVRMIKAADENSGDTASATARCRAQVQAAVQAADGQICTQQIAQMRCPADDTYIATAQNGCIISSLESQGWEVAENADATE